MGFGELTKESRRNRQENPPKEDIPCKGVLLSLLLNELTH